MNELKQQIFEALKDDFQDIETALEANLNPYLDLVSQTAKHILFSGGKRLRPLLMVLAARQCGYKGDYDKTLSTAFEYIHAATLLHDDLVDNASLRRGNPVAHKLWGSSTSVLVGDFLLARSLSIAAKTERPKIIQVIAKITEFMSQGEIHQLSNKGKTELTEEEYLQVIRNKTAYLIQGACQVGAIIADADDPLEQALADFGLNLGMAFQMADDLLDYLADAEILGKRTGADLREGKLTLPVIKTLENASASDRQWMKSIICNPDFSVRDFETLKGMLDRYNGIEYTRHLAATYIQQAKDALDVFGPSKTKAILLNLADYTLARKM